MSKLTKAQAKAHAEACALLAKEVLTFDEKWEVLEKWQESANHVNSAAGAFFTPPYLARDFAIEVSGRRIIDLCAGIGTLSFMYRERCLWGGPPPEIVCVELNPAYIEVGRKILPEATWIEASVFDVPGLNLGRFDCAISNPPFGSVSRAGAGGPRYTGKEFEYHVIDVGMSVADYGVFIIPQMSAPFRYSGERDYVEAPTERYMAFAERTGITLGPNCGIDTSLSHDDWHGVAPRVEIVLATHAVEEAAAVTAPEPAAPVELLDEPIFTPSSEPIPAGQLDLFAEAAE